MPKAFPDSYAQTPTGEILIADGMNPVKVWNGLKAAPIDAGLVAPDDEPTLAAGSAKGNILGLYAAYLRYLDEDGNPSSLSPISTTVDVYKTGGSVTAATDTSPIAITSTAHGLASGDVVRIESVEGNTAANGTWEVTVTGVDAFTLDTSVGNGSYTSGGTWVAGAASIEYTGVDVPSSSKAVRKQILRNTDGQFNVFYVDVDTTSVATTSFSSTNDDDTLSTQTAVPLLTEDGSIFANANDPPPNYKCVLAHHSSRMFAAVDRLYTEGSVSVTNGSATVTGIGTAFTAVLVGRYLYVKGAVRSYLVTAVDVAAQTLTLTAAYASSTDPYATYGIRPAEANRRIINYTPAGRPQSWNVTYGIELQEDGDEITGLMTKGSFLYILEERHIYRFTFQSDPAVDGFIYQSCQRGVVNNRCWVQVEDNTYMLDKNGVHAFGGGQQSESVSDDIQKIFQTIEDSSHVINWNASDTFHAAHFPSEEIIRWFVSMGGNSQPRHALAFHVRTKRWWLEEYPFPVTSSALGLIGLDRRVFLGMESLRTAVASVGFLDGLDKNKGTMYGNVSAADLCSLSDGSAAFASGVVGLQVLITSGKGKLQRRTIHAIDGIRLKVTQPWTIVPDATSTYQIAGVPYRFKSQRFVWAMAEQDKERQIGVMFEPSATPNDAYFRLYEDQNKEPVTFRSTTFGNPEGISAQESSDTLRMDMTKQIAYAQQRLPGHRDDNIQGVRRMQFELEGVGGNDGATFYQFVIDGVE